MIVYTRKCFSHLIYTVTRPRVALCITISTEETFAKLSRILVVMIIWHW